MDEDVEVGDPVVVGRRVLRPIARRHVAGHAGEGTAAAFGHVRPVGLIVESPDGIEAIDLEGEEIELGITWRSASEET